MVAIPEEAMRILVKNKSVALIGSVDSEGTPNISPRFVLGRVGPEKLLFADVFTNKTFANLKAWNRVTAAIVDRETMSGFQLKGEALETEDPELVAEANAKLKEFGFDTKPHRVWILAVNEVYSLKPSEKSRQPLISAYG